MGKIWRLLLLALLLNAALSTAALARPVYLADGGIIEAQKVWQEEGRVYLLLNRDSLITFSPEEINLKKTFAKKKQKAMAKPVAKVEAAPVTATVATAPAAAGTSAAVKTAPSPAAPPAKAASAVTTPAATKGDPAAKVKTPPVAGPAKGAPAPAAKKAVPAKKRPVAAAPATQESPLFLYVALGVGLLFILILVASFWKVFEKAGQAGWKSLIPFYNLFVLLQIAGCPNWWMLMFFLPVVNIYFAVVMHIRLAEKFGKAPLFGFALCFFGFIFFPILAFGPATYGPKEETFSFEEDEFAE